ncbi:MAG: hypothetical protein ACRET0_00125 [Steroidobacteraceae bacterium]
MRAIKRRYEKEIQCLSLAARMVAHEARTQTIRRWSGVSEARVRELYRAYARERGDRYAVRHRGPAPRQPAYFLRTAHIRGDAGALAALCSLLEVIPPQPMPNARRELPNLPRGELLCRAYEMFTEMVGESDLTLEHAALLVTAIAQGTQLRIGHCVHCGGAIVFDPGELGRRACRHCCEEQHASGETDEPAPPASQLPEGTQQSLF